LRELGLYQIPFTIESERKWVTATGAGGDDAVVKGGYIHVVVFEGVFVVVKSERRKSV